MGTNTQSNALIGGIVGALTVTALHQLLKYTDPEAPRMDRLGEQAIAKGLGAAGVNAPTGEELHWAALGGDLLSNAMYYSLAGGVAPQRAVLAGTALGLAAGIGAVALPGPMGLDKSASNRTPRTRVLAVALYTVGGLVAGLTMRAVAGHGR